MSNYLFIGMRLLVSHIYEQTGFKYFVKKIHDFIETKILFSIVFNKMRSWMAQ